MPFSSLVKKPPILQTARRFSHFPRLGRTHHPHLIRNLRVGGIVAIRPALHGCPPSRHLSMAHPEGGGLETSAGTWEGAPPNHLEVLVERRVYVGMVAKKEDLKGQRSQLYHVSDERGGDID